MIAQFLYFCFLSDNSGTIISARRGIYEGMAVPEMDKEKELEMSAREDIVEDIPAASAPKAKPAAAVKPAVKAKKPAEGKAPANSVADKPAAKNAAKTKPAARPAEKKAANSAAKKPAEGKAVPEKKAAAKKPAVKKPAEAPAAESMEEISEKPRKKPLSKKAALRRKRQIHRIIRRSLLCLFSALAVVVFAVYMILFTVFHGPSPTASDLLVNTMLETSALKFVPRIYFSEAEVQEIIARNAIEAPDEATDTSLVVIDRTPKSENTAAEEEKDIELVEVNGATYHGYMMIVKDPSRVTLAVCDPEFDSEYGKFLDEMAEETGALAAINAGGFKDEGGTGRGGKPLGIVVKDGKVLNSRTSDECDIVIGFDKNDKLIVGKMDAEEAVEMELRDAAAFNPILVLNGEPAEVKGSSSGLNPRTAIGQRADGAVLLLVIDGRQVNSLGASLADLIDVMMQFGAVNAANLDGGSSSKMYYQGEFVNDGVALTGSRRLPTAFIVK